MKMKSYVISDNQDTFIGMRLAGIKGVIVDNKEDVLNLLHKIFEEQVIDLVILTEGVFFMAQEEIMKFKIERDHPLIVEIPDRNGSKRGDYLLKCIKESIGLKI